MGCLIIMALQGTLDHWLPVKPWVGTASLGRGMDSRFRGFGLYSTMGSPRKVAREPCRSCEGSPGNFPSKGGGFQMSITLDK